jgi:nicotinamidase-related amidase
VDHISPLSSLKRSALIPIDMQRGFDDPRWAGRGNRSIDAAGRSLLAHWRDHAGLIVHVRHDSIHTSSALYPGTPGHAFREGFEPAGSEPLVVKSVNCAFVGTDLELRLRRAGVDTVVLFGFTTDMCVSTSARIASNLGFRTVVVSDACGAFDLRDGSGAVISAEENHRVHLATLRAEFAEVLSGDEVRAAFVPSARSSTHLSRTQSVVEVV